MLGAIVAYVKAKKQIKSICASSVLMVVVTILEWVPALRINDTDWLYLMVIPLLLCNAYQLLVLHRLIGKQVNQLNREILYTSSYNAGNGMI